MNTPPSPPCPYIIEPIINNIYSYFDSAKREYVNGQLIQIVNGERPYIIKRTNDPIIKNADIVYPPVKGGAAKWKRKEVRKSRNQKHRVRKSRRNRRR